MKLIILGLSLLFSLTTFAKTYPLIRVHNGVDGVKSKMNVEENEYGAVTAFKQVYENSKEPARTYDITKITKGIVLEKKKGYKVVVLKGKNLDYERGGDLEMKFLVNAATSKSKVKEFRISKEPNGWKMFHEGREISVMKFIGNKVPFVGLVGIKKIKIN